MKRLSLLGVLAVGLSSCVARDFSTSNRSEVVLRIVKVQGQGSGADTSTSDFLLSDVVFKGSVINDNGILTLQTVSKNPLLSSLSPVNDVQLTSYTVEYFRSDGRNVQGIDVPYTITGSMATTIAAGNPGPTVQAAIIVVRHQAKDEAPLRNLVDAGAAAIPAEAGADLLTVTARITVYGKTTSGKDVSAVGNLEITFADFGDTTT